MVLHVSDMIPYLLKKFFAGSNAIKSSICQMLVTFYHIIQSIMFSKSIVRKRFLLKRDRL